MLVQPKALYDDLSNVRVFDATVILKPSEKGGLQAISGREGFEQAHVPGAAFLDLVADLSDTTTGLGFSLPEPSNLARAFATNGITIDTPIVLYSHGHVMWATRALWLLRSLGHEQASVLDGGLEAWRAAGLPVESGEHSYPPAEDFGERPRDDLFVRLEEMRTLVDDGRTCVVNALPEAVYTGEGQVHYGRRGHIPGSLNLPYDNLLDAGRFKNEAALRDALAATGLDTNERAVTYCGGGIAATVPAFARLLCSIGETAVYDGSMSEWVREGLPLTEGATP